MVTKVLLALFLKILHVIPTRALISIAKPLHMSATPIFSTPLIAPPSAKIATKYIEKND